MAKLAKYISLFYLISALIFQFNYSFGQLKNESELPGVKLIGKSDNSSILLRWAPNSPVAWQLALKYGYTVERFTMSRNNQLLPDPVVKILTPTPLKPWTLDAWEKMADRDDNAAIAAQAMFGETFELTNNYSTDILQVINKAKELESRFSFALFAADQSIEVAQASGLYYKDDTVLENEKYLYRVYANIPNEVTELDTGAVFLGLKDYIPLPVPRALAVEFGDKTALVSWNGQEYYRFYNSFILERSDDDGRNYNSVTKKPIVNTFKANEPLSKYIFKVDTLDQNLKKYLYRVRGISAFGEISPPSDTVSGFGRPEFQYTASISRTEIINQGSHVLITWEFPSQGIEQVKEFIVSRSYQQGGPYVDIAKGLNKNTVQYTDESPLGSNYYIIKALDAYGTSNISYPYFVQLEDSIPPIRPKELTGGIDTLGIVSLSWKENEEQDLLGYRVYRANFRSDEFIQVTSEPLTTNSFQDTIMIKSLNKDIYYTVQAVDKRFNNSERSEILGLKKPDVIPPVPPVFKKVQALKGSVQIEWVRSSSIDVANHLLYRRSAKSSQWALISVLPKDSTIFSDENIDENGYYEYTMIAVDETNLESGPAKTVKVMVVNDLVKPPIENIFSKPDRDNRSIEIVWDYPLELIQKYIIYRSNGEEPISTYRTQESNTFIDKNLQVNTSYNYRVKAVFTDGSESKLSKIISVKY